MIGIRNKERGAQVRKSIVEVVKGSGAHDNLKAMGIKTYQVERLFPFDTEIMVAFVTPLEREQMKIRYTAR